MGDGIHGAMLMLRHLDAEGVAEVLARLVSSEGPDAVAVELRTSASPTDALVDGVLAVGLPELRRALAHCHQLTPQQMRRVLRRGGPDDETAAVLFPNRMADAAFSPVRPLPGPAALSGPAAAESALLDTRCPDDLADAILERYPHLAYVVRNKHPGVVRLLRGDRRPVGDLEAGEIARVGLSQGALTVRDFVERMRPAGAALSALSGVCGTHPMMYDEVAEVLAPRLAPACGTHLRAWTELCAALPTFDGTLAELLDAFAEKPVHGGDVLSVPDHLVPGLSFLLLQLSHHHFTELLPQLPDGLLKRLAYDVPEARADELAEFAFASRKPALLLGLARRHPVTPDTVERLVRLDDPAVNRVLVENYSVGQDVRHRIFLGVAHGPVPGGRLPLDPELSALGMYAAPETLAASGDPLLARRALTGTPKLRVAERIAVAIAVWERGGAELLCRIPGDAFGTTAGRLVGAAIATDSPDVLCEARDRHTARQIAAGAAKPSPRASAQTATPPWYEADWEARNATTKAVDQGQLTAEQAVRETTPARHTLHALHQVAFHNYTNAVDAVLAGYVHEHLNGDNRADAWAVLVQLLPEFEGTLLELLTVTAAVAH